MSATDWILLILGIVYLLFNLKKIFSFTVGSFFNNGTMFTLWIVWFVAIWIMVFVFAFFAPQYSKYVQWTFIWSVVGFLVYRNTIGFKND